MNRREEERRKEAKKQEIDLTLNHIKLILSKTNDYTLTADDVKRVNVLLKSNGTEELDIEKQHYRKAIQELITGDTENILLQKGHHLKLIH